MKCPFCPKSLSKKTLLPHLSSHADQEYEKEVAARLKVGKIEEVIRKYSRKK